jgi:hypothetical protein
MNAPTLPELARQAMVGSTFAGAVKDAETAAKRQIAEQAAAAGMKTLSLTVTGDDGTEYGLVVLNKGRAGGNVAEVTDPEALLAWVKANMPERVKVVESVDPAWLERVLAYAKANGTTGCADTEGAVLPGVTVTEKPAGAPTVSVRPTPAARERAAAVLAGTDLLALPAAPAVELVDQGDAEAA